MIRDAKEGRMRVEADATNTTEDGVSEAVSL